MTRIIDLSLAVEERMLNPYHMGKEPTVSLTVTKTHDAGGVHGTSIAMYLHMGTHIDAPMHFIRGGDTIEDLALYRLVGEAIALDLRHKKGQVPIERADLEEAMKKVKPSITKHTINVYKKVEEDYLKAAKAALPVGNSYLG